MKLFHPLLFGLSLHSFRTAASCYYPNGSDVNYFHSPDVYMPCNAGDDVSMCCALNRNVADKCRSDGLCLSTWDSNIWRDGCTDPTWKSPQCIKLCTEGTSFYREGTVPKNLSNFFTTITPCRDGSYCCGNGTIGQGCCDDGKGVFLLNGEIVSSNPSTATSTITAFSATKSSITASSSSATTSLSSPRLPLATTSSSSSPDKSYSARTTAIIVGTVLGVALILGMGFAMFLLKRLQHKRLQAVTTDRALVSPMVSHTRELYGDDGAKELNGRGHEVELDGVGI